MESKKIRKIRLGDYIQLSEEKNNDLSYSLSDVRGVSIKKTFINTKADMNGVALNPYLLVKPNYFCYVPVTSRNGEKITITLNMTNDTYIVSSSYIVFYIKDTETVDPYYLFMLFNRGEFDRYSRFHSWGSAREVFSYSDMENIELELPEITIQRKYAEVYKSMLKNMNIFESNLNDLKLVCDSYVEKLRRENGDECIGRYIEEINLKNQNSNIKTVLGISKDGFISPNQKPGDLGSYKMFSYNNFVYSPPRINVGSIGLFKENKKAVCSPIYVVFKVKDENKLNPDYLMLWLRRNEFLRSTDFYSIASVRNNFSYDLMEKVRICIPDKKVQDDIVCIMSAYDERKKYLSELKKKIFDICPVLIAGSIKEAKGDESYAN